MEDFFVWNKSYDEYISCCDCGCYFKPKSIFIKRYKDMTICLCKKCAKNLRDEIEEKFGVE